MVWENAWFDERGAIRLDDTRQAVVGPQGELMGFDEWLDALKPILGRHRLERLLRAEIGSAEFTAKRGDAVYCVRARRRAGAIELLNATAEEYAARRALLCEMLRTAGALCFEYDADLDELITACGKDERVIPAFSQGEYGPLVRAALAAKARSGSVELDLGRAWYTKVAAVADGPRKYVGALIPDSAHALHLDRRAELSYTGFWDEERRRFERYKLLGEDAGGLIVDYDPAADTLLCTIFMEDGARVENSVENCRSCLGIYDRIAPESREICRRHALRALSGPTSCAFEFRANFGEGHRWYRARYVSAVDGAGNVCRVVAQAEEIEEEMADRADLIRCAYIDEVTGLYNRRAAQQRIMEALAGRRASRYDALFVIDVDDLKQINDSRGHLEGDAALRLVADAISAVFRESDVKGRFGGDEFIVYMRGFMDPALPGVVAARLMSRLSAEGGVSCSVGAALAAQDARFEDLFVRADRALYQAKAEGKSGFALSRE
jgi:diguanylate cyclase (GGDEF)-like protein